MSSFVFWRSRWISAHLIAMAQDLIEDRYGSRTRAKRRDSDRESQSRRNLTRSPCGTSTSCLVCSPLRTARAQPRAPAHQAFHTPRKEHILPVFSFSSRRGRVIFVRKVIDGQTTNSTRRPSDDFLVLAPAHPKSSTKFL